MKINDRAEEILETLWVHAAGEKQEPSDLGITKGEPAIDELWKSGHIKLIKDKITLTEKGITEGQKIVRRHSLAERLLADPHGKSIPQGECCQKSIESINRVVSSLVNLPVNQKAKVAYIHTRERKKLEKIMAMGVLPGMAVTLVQNFPSYVFQIGQSQFAIDRDLAEFIFVRIIRS